MHKLKNIFRNINLLNIILIAAIILMAKYTILPLFNVNIKYTLPAAKKIIGDNEGIPAEGHIPSPSDYIIIAEENLFHPERKIPVESKAEQPLPKPEFVLYGTMITDNTRVAYLEDKKSPHTTTGRGKRQVVLKKGDSLSGFTLKEIEPDKVVMVRGEERIEVNVTDSVNPKRKDTGVSLKESKPATKKTISSPSRRRPPTP
jgi:type II secretory pathway component PulC